MHRIPRLRKLVRDKGLDGLIVSDLTNVRYLSGFTGSNGVLLLTPKTTWFYTDFRYQEQMKREVRGCRRKVLARSLYSAFPKEHVRRMRRLGVEKHNLTVEQLHLLKEQLKGMRLVPTRNLVLELRRRKDPQEVRLIQRAQNHTDRVLQTMLGLLKPGAKERDIAAEIVYRFAKVGECAFPPIVASGPNSALPHAGASDRRLRKGDPVTIDLGCRCQGYCSDMTRTVFLGEPKEKLRRIYDIVLAAQQEALALIRPGVACADVDRAARNYIKDHGYGEYFGHGLGHGVGLEVHESPGLAPRVNQVLAAGDVVTVEPGIYVPGLGGVRIEDMVLVTRSGYRNFTHSPKNPV